MKNKNFIIILLFFVISAKFVLTTSWEIDKMSWYGEPFFSRKTANGEIYNRLDFTFANNELPFGTLVEFEYKGKKVIARCNDKGGFEKYGRKFDLSYRVAKELGIIKIGIADIKWRIIYQFNMSKINFYRLENLYF